jgi:Ca2+-binding EF-hand superfamily protein
MKLANILITGALLGGVAMAQDDEKTFGDGGLPEFLQQYDTNDDGVIDEEERQAIKAARKAAREERRAEIDTDGDGEISSEEREAAREAIRERIAAKRAEKFAEIAGEDGVLSLEEFAALPPLKRASEERVASIFARLDADDSGDVSLEEFNMRLRGHRPPSRPRPGHGGPRGGEEGGERPPRPEGR